MQGGFKSLINKLYQNDFIKNIFILLSGSSIALVIPILLMPIIARFFSPEDFGLWGTFSAIVGLFAVIANGRYEFALLLPEEEKDAANLFWGSLIITLLLSALSFILILVFGHWLCDTINNERLYKWLYIIPFSIIIIAIQQAGNYWLNRHKEFKTMSSGRVIQSSSTAFLNIGIGKFLYFPSGLIISTLIGQTLLSVFYLWKIKIRKIYNQFSFSGAKEMLYKYREYPFKSGPGIFINILKEQAPIFLLGYYFNDATVGFYSLIIRIFGAPLSLVAGSIGQVYYQKAVEMHKNNGSVIKLFVKTTSRLVLLLILPTIAIFIWGEQIFQIFFGDEWKEAGKILAAFSIYYSVRFVVSSQSSLLLVFNKLTVEVLFNIIALILQISALVIGGFYKDFNLTIYLIAISGILMYSGLGGYLFLMLKRRQ